MSAATIRARPDVREKIGEGFEIVQIRFHEPTVEPRTFGRDDWREMPLAYLVLRAKDPAVDRIPSVELDLEFADGHGFVVLPISSAVQLVDARSVAAERPLAELKIKQVLDDRKPAEKVVRLEIAATGKGLIPDLDRLLQLDELHGENGTSPLAVADTVDHGITIGGLDTESEKVCPNCERRWTVNLVPRGEVRPTEFRFPTARVSPAELTFARFDDADLVAAESVAPLRSWPLSTRQWIAPAVAAAVAVLGIGAIAVVVRRRRRRVGPHAALRYQRPDLVTPFSAISLLKRLVADPSLGLSAADRTELAVAVNELENRYFERTDALADGKNGDDRDFEDLLDEWLHKVCGEVSSEAAIRAGSARRPAAELAASRN